MRVIFSLIRMNESDVGVYECHVTNEHGASRQRIKMALSEYPRVLQPLEELHLRANSSGKIMCRIAGFPACQVKWYRDWEPLVPSYRFKVGVGAVGVGVIVGVGLGYRRCGC